MYCVLLVLSHLLPHFSLCLSDIDSTGAVLLTSPLLNISVSV